MNRRNFLAGCAAAALLSSRSLRAAETAIPLAGVALEARITTLMAHHAVPGLAYAVLRDGALTGQGGLGLSNAESAAPVDANTVFEAASLTKPLLAQTVMKMSEEGAIDLSRPLVDYHRPEAPVEKQDWFDLITARHVLSHTTGLPNWHQSRKPVPQRFQPGEKFSYSGMAFVLLQRAVEKIMGVPFDAFIAEKLFTPLTMKSASLVWRADYETRLAFGHGPNGKPTRGQMPQAIAASSLVCTAADYGRFLEMLLNPAQTAPLQLTPETRTAMLTPVIDAATGVHWGLGWGLEAGAPGFNAFHWGNNGERYNAFAVWNPTTRDAVVIMTNSGNGLRLCKELVPELLPGPHPAFEWKMVVR